MKNKRSSADAKCNKHFAKGAKDAMDVELADWIEGLSFAEIQKRKETINKWSDQLDRYVFVLLGKLPPSECSLN